MNIKKLIKQPEGRRLEFKGELPENADLAKTIVAFANDAGGELYIGIGNNPRELVGIAEDDLMAMEEKMSCIIHDRCYPAILPEITFLTEDDKHLIRVTIYRGSTPPYYLKDKGKLRGTYIRVGSTNRKADETIIAELERIRRNISFDSEIVVEKPAHQLNIDNFAAMFQEKTGEAINTHTLRKLNLTKELNDVAYPTNALVLLSDDELRNTMFHFAKVECARFKGTVSDEFIDQKSITTHIATQAEETYSFVLRHINKGATVKGIYTVAQWEYPVKAIREVIRNAIVHRDYSFTGKDVKVAIYDDMIEITSPGLLPPSIDYSAMDSRQSDARNKVIAPTFRRLGIIDQWGNGLRLIADELKEYPRIGFQWKEVGLSFQVQFVKLDFEEEQELQQKQQELGQKAELEEEISRMKLQQEQQEFGTELQQELDKQTLYSTILQSLKTGNQSRREISTVLGQKKVSGQLNIVIQKLISDALVERTIPESPNHPAQKFRITQRGKMFLELLKTNNY